MQQLGWTQADVILFSGDAYIDHPSFGSAVIARVLENLGLKVAMVPQPNWRDDLRDFKKLGRPRLFFGVSAGNMDSMINHYTANKRLRSDDMFTSGGKAGSRPDYAVTVYTSILKKLFPETPVILGGIEASLRRLGHYDYWSDTVKPSVLIDSKADLLVYGMGEKSIITIVQRLIQGVPITSFTDIPQTAFVVTKEKFLDQTRFERSVDLIPFGKTCKNKIDFARNFRTIEEESNRDDAARITESYGERTVVVNPPFTSYSQEEIDAPYALPYTRMPHPRYSDKEPIPAYEMIRDSVNIHRGCFGGCSFCTISAHQGKHILSRSEASILAEVQNIINTPGFRGNLSDLGGPSANMYRMRGKKTELCAKCRRASCIFPALCKNMNNAHKPLTELYRKVKTMPGIKKVFVGSGVRYDLLYGSTDPEMQKQAREYFRELVLHHVSGRLKVAPEHQAPHVLKMMRKPPFEMFLRLKSDFESICRTAGIKQQVIPYMISSHPGSTATDMAALAGALRQLGYFPEQVQDFTPTPLTLSSAIYYSGVDPYTLKAVYTARSSEDKKDQQRFFFYYKPENRNIIRQQLIKMKRMDLADKLFSTKHSR